MKINLIFMILLAFTSSRCFAGPNDFVFNSGHIAMLAPPVVNKDYYLLEFGFITEKKFQSYNYNAYVTAALFEDWRNKENDLRAGALGFKGGIIIPTQPWVPLLATLSTGFAKTVLHKSPLVGRDEQSAAKKNMILLEAGALYRYDQYFLRFVYQVSNVKYFNRHTFIMLGVNY